MPKIFNEDEILNAEFRKKVIEEIEAPENYTRKLNMYKRFEIYKDNTYKYVIDALAKEGMKETTLAQMQNRASNISICKKIVNKKARCYVGGVKRILKSPEQQTKIDDISRLMCTNTVNKKADKYRELFKNCMGQVVPELDTVSGKYNIRYRILAPYQYDVIENGINRERADVVILSDYVVKGQPYASYLSEDVSNNGLSRTPKYNEGNGRDETIADYASDANADKKKTYIWWGSKYHFTTDDKGGILKKYSPDDILNPIQQLPFVNIAEEQDGQFWAQGGNDLIDGSVLVNVTITDMLGIAYIQGWAQMVVIGKNLPKGIAGGPHTAMILDVQEGEPIPDVKFVSGNPPLDLWMQATEQYVALLLSTNDLTPSSIANKLDATQFPSGIAMLVEQSEATSNIEDKQHLFKEVERVVAQITEKWQNLYFESKALTEEFTEIGFVDFSDLAIQFIDQKPAVTEKEKLENIKLRKELGIDSQVDLIMIDNPSLTREEAETKLKKILADKITSINTQVINNLNQQGAPDGEEKTSKEKKQEVDQPVDYGSLN